MMVIPHYTMPAVLDALHKAVAGENLTAGEASAALEEILEGATPAALVSALSSESSAWDAVRPPRIRSRPRGP